MLLILATGFYLLQCGFLTLVGMTVKVPVRDDDTLTNFKCKLFRYFQRAGGRSV